MNWRVLIALFVLASGLALSYGLMLTRATPQLSEAENVLPAVKTLVVHSQTLPFTVKSQGTVSAQQELNLVAETSGKVLALHPDLVAGGQFKQGELLIQLDSHSAELAIVQAQGQLAEAKRVLAMELAQAEQARTEWHALGQGKPSALVLHEPQVAEAQAKVSSAEAQLTQAQLQKQHCQLYAPFTGRVRQKQVTIGQWLNTGESVAQIYASAVAEIRLPVSLAQLAFIALPNHSVPYQQGIPVKLSAEIAGTTAYWSGRIVRSEGVVQSNTGMVYLVAQVLQPYQHAVPLWNGLFVQAEIQGKNLTDIIVVPQQAMNALQKVTVVDAELKVHSRAVEVLQQQGNDLWLKSGLHEGERVVLSGLDIVLENSRVVLND